MRKVIITLITTVCAHVNQSSDSILCDFCDIYAGGLPPPWPEGFEARLEVIKFNYVKDGSTGVPAISTGNNVSLRYSEMSEFIIMPTRSFICSYLP